MNRIIADSGSTKTDWVLLADGKPVRQFQTQGINPFHQDRSAIADVLCNELLPAVGKQVDAVNFFGSGVRPELEPLMVDLLSQTFPSAQSVEAHGDLLGAAIAVCGSRPGLGCILGTGANSCLFDGQHIVANTPPLGYILGDEGSGAVLGRRFLNTLLKGFLSESLREAFFEAFQITEGGIIERVYRQPLANRWLASLSPFIHRHLGDPGVRPLVVDNFRDFFRRNLVQYGRRDLPVGAVGSVAWYYQSELAEAAMLEGFTIGRIERSPIDGLIKHFSI